VYYVNIFILQEISIIEYVSKEEKGNKDKGKLQAIEKKIKSNFNPQKD
jgi:hypothetical protein